MRVLLQEGKLQNIDYKDTRCCTYISERGKIRARRVTAPASAPGDIAIAVKNAREVALLPFTSATR